MYSESKRVEFLDSIRGLAALFVLLSHITGTFAWPPADFSYLNWPFLSILSEGKEAVAMFFVLSGYVLSKPYVTAAGGRPARKIFLPTFYLRRFTRIWIPWFAIFVISIGARKFLFFQPPTDPPVTKWLGQFWLAPLTAGDFFRQCAFLLHDASRQLLAQDWSLGIELKGSVLIPFFLLLATGKRVLALLGLAGLLVALVGTGPNYVSFIVAVLLAQHGDALVGPLRRSSQVVKMGLLLLGLMLYQGFSLTLDYYGEPAAYKIGWVISSLGCAGVLLAVFSSNTLQKILNHKTLVFLGRVSYSVYLLQFIIILCALPPLVRRCNQAGIHDRFGLFGLTILAGVLLTVGLAAATYRFIEVPAINLGHYLTKKIQQRWQK
jgi:peptidoglycan/LPS O-acetylase OafA/YrhL